MEWLYFFLVLLGFICFALAAKRRDQKYNLVALGLALWILVEVIIRFRLAAGV